ncbi:MAG: acetyl-CoA carboxylase biotin carboxyl carrier protein [Acidobacteria bacterium]|nr:acetyl-CoA carboxylase biotin carboxyl carrier protein [Acidobacteriota bacterium]
MDLEDIKQLLELVRAHDLAEFELERDGLKLRVRKAGREIAHGVIMAPHEAVAPAAIPVAVPAASASTGAAPAKPEPADAVDLGVIKSPIVGTFYSATEPGAPPFVQVGDRVAKGQVLCIIEAMKLMNEIESDCDGEIVKVYVENGKAVQFGDRLFAIKVS